ncbi:potassium/proton antiporter (CPA1 family) [Antricoccus suffuscus]|uniref:Potassium/proton antiporter (CPA1 family) n=1 Tax=Antricoccus suffuscus TaxID=1629062 RepID=A0A2T0Z5R4_9ACTN|nr:potassium/proton antiporter [Antricoccus suffuscus]PRZ31676.1 potassium/proton antiporter (CPA1 family) [Antricoccus suffuscus]
MVLALTLLVSTSVLLVAILAIRFSSQIGLPSLLLYLGIGVLVGESGLGVQFEDFHLANSLGTVALAIILGEGGLTTRWHEVRPQLTQSVLLSTLGVFVSVGIMATFLVVVLGFGWQVALVIGAIVSSTDAAAVFSVLRRLRLPQRITATMELESGLNDAPVVILVTVLSVPARSIDPWWAIVLLIIYELVVGAIIGFSIAWVGVQLLRRGTLPSSGLYAVTAIVLLIFTFSVASLAHTSGFLAVYVAGVVFGNAQLPYKRATIAFAEAIAWLAQIGLFVMLGLLVSPPEIPGVVVPALLVGGVLLFVARPVSVFLSSLWSRVSLRDQAFYSWSGLRGAVPIVVATIPITHGIPRSGEILHMVFVLVVIFTLVQGTTLPQMARALRLAGKAETEDVDVEVSALDQIAAEVLTVSVPAGSRMHGVYVGELRLPATGVVSLIVRGDKRFVPQRDTRIRVGDSLLIVSATEDREATERRLHAIARAGRLATWQGENGG